MRAQSPSPGVAGNMRRSSRLHTPSAQSEALTHTDYYEPSPLLPFQGVSGLSAACEKQNDLISRPNTAGWDELMPSNGRSALGKALYEQTPEQGVAELPLGGGRSALG